MAFQVDTGKLKRIASDCETKARQYEDLRRSLAAQCQQLESNWKGVSSKGFQTISSEWCSSSQATGAELLHIARRLRELAEYYERLDREERERERKKKRN